MIFTLRATGASAGLVEDCRFTEDSQARIAHCTKAIDSRKWRGFRRAWAFVNRGAAYDDLKQYDRALEDYSKALRVYPDDPDALHNRGNTYCEMGRRADAVRDYRSAVAVSERISRLMQVFLRDLGHYSGAIDGVFGSGSQEALRRWAQSACVER
ncbi:MAG: tetratricopeptide repeat protein [Pseudomonadota bacterium]